MTFKKHINSLCSKDIHSLSLEYICFMFGLSLVNFSNKLSNTKKYDNSNNKLRIKLEKIKFILSLLLVYTNLLLGYYRSCKTSIKPCNSAIRGY